jgi:hypothetical protein
MTETNALLLAFTLRGTVRSGFRVHASRDEGMISDGMFSDYAHFKSFATIEEAEVLLKRIVSGAHYCPRYNSLGRSCNLAHWTCRSGAFADKIVLDLREPKALAAALSSRAHTL